MLRKLYSFCLICTTAWTACRVGAFTVRSLCLFLSFSMSHFRMPMLSSTVRVPTVSNVLVTSPDHRTHHSLLRPLRKSARAPWQRPDSEFVAATPCPQWYLSLTRASLLGPLPYPQSLVWLMDTTLRRWSSLLMGVTSIQHTSRQSLSSQCVWIHQSLSTNHSTGLQVLESAMWALDSHPRCGSHSSLHTLCCSKCLLTAGATFGRIRMAVIWYWSKTDSVTSILCRRSPTHSLCKEHLSLTRRLQAWSHLPTPHILRFQQFFVLFVVQREEKGKQIMITGISGLGFFGPKWPFCDRLVVVFLVCWNPYFIVFWGCAFFGRICQKSFFDKRTETLNFLLITEKKIWGIFCFFLLVFVWFWIFWGHLTWP